MSNTLEYKLSLRDKFSSVANKLATSLEAVKNVADKINAGTSKMSNVASATYSKMSSATRHALMGSDKLKTSIEGLKDRLTLAHSSISNIENWI